MSPGSIESMRGNHCVLGFLEDADVNKSEVDEIVLVGGSTRIPKQGVFSSRGVVRHYSANFERIFVRAVKNKLSR